MDRRAWRATVHRVARSQTRLSNFTHTHTHTLELYNTFPSNTFHSFYVGSFLYSICFLFLQCKIQTDSNSKLLYAAFSQPNFSDINYFNAHHYLDLDDFIVCILGRRNYPKSHTTKVDLRSL